MKVLNISYALPSLEVTNEDMVREIMDRNRHLDRADRETVEAKVRRFFRMAGTQTRYHRAPGEKAVDFAVKAGREAMRKAGVRPDEVDLLIYAGVGRGWVEPATANLFQSELGLTNATCFDVLDACASWIRSLSIARSFLAENQYNTVMVLNCEFNFREYANFEIRNPAELENTFSAFTMGEAATATVLTRGEAGDDSSFTFRSWGDKHGLCKIALPNAADFSVGKVVDRLKPLSFFTVPSELLSFTIKKLAAHFGETGIASRVHDIIFIHAVSVPAVQMVLKLLNLDPDRSFDTHARFGNTVSASLPLALSVAEEEGRLHRGDRMLFLMGSAGVTTAVGHMTY